MGENIVELMTPKPTTGQAAARLKAKQKPQGKPLLPLTYNDESGNIKESYGMQKAMIGFLGGATTLISSVLAVLGKVEGITPMLHASAGIAAVAVGATAIGLYATNKAEQKKLKQAYDNTTQNLLTNAFTRNGSAHNGKIDYDEQCQMYEIIHAKNNILKDLGYRSSERQELERYHNDLIIKFALQESDHGEKITYDEQCQLRELLQRRKSMIIDA